MLCFQTSMITCNSLLHIHREVLTQVETGGPHQSRHHHLELNWMRSSKLRSLALSIEPTSPSVSLGEALAEVMTLLSFSNRNLLKPTANLILFLCLPCYMRLLYLREGFLIRILLRPIPLPSVEIHLTTVEIIIIPVPLLISLFQTALPSRLLPKISKVLLHTMVWPLLRVHQLHLLHLDE